MAREGVGHRAAWERQQRLAALATQLRRVPALADSKLLLLASQLGPILRQLGAADGVPPAAQALLQLAYLDGAGAANRCLLVCLAARACQGSDNAKIDGLAAWHGWRLDPGEASLLLTPRSLEGGGCFERA